MRFSSQNSRTRSCCPTGRSPGSPPTSATDGSVVVLDEDRGWKRVRAGIIQGSGVLSSILFLLLIIDDNIACAASIADLLKYADDIPCYVTGKDVDTLPQAIFEAVDRWCVVPCPSLLSSSADLPHAHLGQPRARTEPLRLQRRHSHIVL